MKLLYHIPEWAPCRETGNCGFVIKLWPAWADVVKARRLGEAEIRTAVRSLAPAWLSNHGYDLTVYDPRTSIRVSPGPWGPEHISVPGNACGLDLADGIHAPRGGRVMLPHNVDSVRQAALLMTVFLFFADTLMLHQECEEYRRA